MSIFTMKSLPEAERPYEKCEKYGPTALSDAELLAVILRTGSKDKTAVELATEVLNLHPAYRNLTALYHLSGRELRNVRGIGAVKAIQIMCIGELSRRIARTNVENTISFSNPQSVADYFMEQLRHLPREEIHVMFFDTKLRLLCERKIAEGTVKSAQTTPREILIEAMKCEAVFMILVHNHPSGLPKPSQSDLLFTNRVKEAGDLVGITLSDHIIIGDNCYVSLKERGLLS